MPSAVRFAARASVVYIGIAVVAALVKIATPLFSATPWSRLLLVDAVGATLVSFVYHALVRFFTDRIERRTPANRREAPSALPPSSGGSSNG